MNNWLKLYFVLAICAVWQMDVEARCANFGGGWQAHQSGGIRCDVAPQVNQPFSLIGPVDVEQHGCRFSYPDFNGRQKGKIKGRKIKIPKPAVHPAFLNLFSTKSVKGEGHGRVQSGERARVKISSRVKGEINGIRTTCVVKSTTNFVRLPPVLPPPPPPPRPVIPPRLDFRGAVVSANYEWPNLGSILYAGGTMVAPAVFFTLGGQNIIVDVSSDVVRIIYPNRWTFGGGPRTFDGIVISVVSGDMQTGTAPITSVSLLDTNIPGYDGTQLSFDATHLYINQLGFSSFPPGSFIRIFVGFGR